LIVIQFLTVKAEFTTESTRVRRNKSFIAAIKMGKK